MRTREIYQHQGKFFNNGALHNDINLTLSLKEGGINNGTITSNGVMTLTTTEIQLCVVHQIRNSLKHIGSVNQKEFMKDLKTVYQAETLDLAEYNLEKFDQKCGTKYPIVLKS